MTAIVRQAASVPGLPDLIRRRVTGTPTEVETTLAMVRQSGHLVAATAPRQLYTNDPRVTVLVTLRRTPVPALPLARPVRRNRLVKPLTIGGVSILALAGLGVGGYYALRATVHAAAAASPMALGILATVALVLLIAGRSGKVACLGMHCGGCSKH